MGRGQVAPIGRKGDTVNGARFGEKTGNLGETLAGTLENHQAGCGSILGNIEVTQGQVVPIG